MRSKRGVGAIVAWVLLLGFAIALATMIFMWTTRQTETLTESTVEYVEGEMQCQNIKINVKDLNAGSPDTNCTSFDIINVGYLALEDVVVREFFMDGTVDSTDKTLSSNLEPKTSKTELDGSYKTKIPQTGSFCLPTRCNKVEFLPVVIISNRKVGCKDRALGVTC